MARSALKQTQVESLEISRVPDSCSLSEFVSPMFEAPAFTKAPGGLSISTASGLKGARGFMMAIGLEAAAALVIYAIWLAWHVLR